MSARKIWLCVDKRGGIWGDGSLENAENYATAPTDRIVQFQPVPKKSARARAR